jgi:hypothetical protein
MQKGNPLITHVASDHDPSQMEKKPQQNKPGLSAWQKKKLSLFYITNESECGQETSVTFYMRETINLDSVWFLYRLKLWRAFFVLSHIDLLLLCS